MKDCIHDFHVVGPSCLLKDSQQLSHDSGSVCHQSWGRTTWHSIVGGLAKVLLPPIAAVVAVVYALRVLHMEVPLYLLVGTGAEEVESP
jgi:hypothetical protein